jgi:hypothetical protein
LLFAHAPNASAASAPAFPHPTLFVLGDAPTSVTPVFEDATLHHFLIEATQQTIKRLSLAQSDRHGVHPLYSTALDRRVAYDYCAGFGMFAKIHGDRVQDLPRRDIRAQLPGVTPRAGRTLNRARLLQTFQSGGNRGASVFQGICQVVQGELPVGVFSKPDREVALDTRIQVEVNENLRDLVQVSGDRRRSAERGMGIVMLGERRRLFHWANLQKR